VEVNTMMKSEMQIEEDSALLSYGVVMMDNEEVVSDFWSGLRHRNAKINE
jgi:hypothetical protein